MQPAEKLMDEKLFAVLAREAGQQASGVETQTLRNTAWAFATVNLLDDMLLAALASEAQQA